MIENGVKLLCKILQKGFHRLLHSALLFYLKLITDLQNNSFVLHPHDPCVANNLVNEEMMIVVWRVNYNKVSHKDPFEVIKFSAYLSTIYVKKLKVNRGELYDYFGIDLYYSDPSVVKISTINHLQKGLYKFPEK